MTETNTHRQSTFREYYESLIIVAIFVTFARIFVFQTFKIPTPSMEDNLLVGDHIIVNKFLFGASESALFRKLFPFHDVARGDTIVFRFPRELENDYVKRVVGLPGETVLIRDKRVFIDGRELAEPYTVFADPQVFPSAESLPDQFRYRDQFGPFLVPPGSYFAMGDNRDLSYDSRYWGPVDRELIKGKPLLVYWSFRGQPLLPGSPPGEKLKELLGVAVNFFRDTRWDRTFFIIDSQFHYHAEPRDGSRDYE
ncbi:MAG TPA: signal peptidase I [Thermoanaerobaculia bacterium]|nr:signal peptidase I [Thermoanaerobaculia bacterium]